MSPTDNAQEQAADRAAAAGDAAAAARMLDEAVAAQPDRAALWAKLSAMRRALGDGPAALAAIDRALALQPLDFSALLARAFLLERAGDPRAGDAFCNAIAQEPPEEEIPPAMQGAVVHARQRSVSHRAALEAEMLRAVGDAILDPAERGRIERFISNSSHRTRHFHQEPTHFHYPGLPEIEFHDPQQFPELADLERHTAAIREEFEALIAAEAAEMVPYIQYPDRVPLRQWQKLNNSRDWSAVHLLQNGRLIEANARHCPRTMAAIDVLPQPQVPGASPNAMFSLLAPRTRIPAHTGVANTRLVCHLPLIVPSGCGFRVGETSREWREGEAFVFDDTIEHEAWNDSDQLRVVLILDLWAPALGADERTAVAAIIAAAGVGFSGEL
jgi:aspartyl/asparaginyl beta-hydroxylase (cupin superfamily)